MTAAAAAPLRPLLTTAPRALHVAAVFPAAVYLADPSTARVVLSVVTSDGVTHPNAVRLRAVSGERPFAGTRDHDAIEVGDDRVDLPTGSVSITRWWSPRPVLGRVARPRLQAAVDHLVVELGHRAAPLPDDLAERFRGLTLAVAAGREQAAVAAVDRLLGLGAGLTPTGDDLMAGLLAAMSTLAPVTAPASHLRASSEQALGAVAERIGACADAATTAISAALLRHAVRGEVCGPAADVLRALVASPSGAGRDPAAALAGLLRVGGTSGRDLALGLFAGAALVAAGPPEQGRVIGSDRRSPTFARHVPSRSS